MQELHKQFQTAILMHRGDNMKKLFLILCAATMLNVMPLAAVPNDPISDPSNYPEYTGSLDDPDLLVIYRGKGYIIVQLKNKTLVYYHK